MPLLILPIILFYFGYVPKINQGSARVSFFKVESSSALSLKLFGICMKRTRDYYKV
jgi:hypothetical protein